MVLDARKRRKGREGMNTGRVFQGTTGTAGTDDKQNGLRQPRRSPQPYRHAATMQKQHDGTKVRKFPRMQWEGGRGLWTGRRRHVFPDRPPVPGVSPHLSCMGKRTGKMRNGTTAYCSYMFLCFLLMSTNKKYIFEDEKGKKRHYSIL